VEEALTCMAQQVEALQAQVKLLLSSSQGALPMGLHDRRPGP